MDTSTPFYFVDQFLEKLLADEGLNLTEEQKGFYIPQLSAMAEKQVGATLMERLNDTQLAEFQSLFEKDTTTGEEWNHFWKTSIPDFESAVQSSLQTFADKVKTLLAKTA